MNIENLPEKCQGGQFIFTCHFLPSTLHFPRLAFIFLFFLAFSFFRASSALPAVPDLPFTEDFYDTSLMHVANTSASLIIMSSTNSVIELVSPNEEIGGQFGAAPIEGRFDCVENDF